eukprot:jgi/Hompol1/5943/HPOL_000908-RA
MIHAYTTKTIQYSARYLPAPQGYLTELIAARIRKRDCVDRGWILDGFPLNKSDSEALRSKGVVPNRVIWLEASQDTCMTRLIHRRYDPVTGRVINLTSIPKEYQKVDVSGLTSRPEDDAETVQSRIDQQAGLKQELEKVFGVRKSEDSTGVMYEIDAEGIGEADARRDHPSFERVLELVEGSLMRPIPIQVNAEY